MAKTRNAKNFRIVYGATLDSDAATLTGTPCLLFDPPASASAGTTIDLSGRIVLRSAGAHATFDPPKLSVREDRDSTKSNLLPLTPSGNSAYATKLALPESPKKIYLTFESTVDGTLLRAERSIDVH